MGLVHSCLSDAVIPPFIHIFFLFFFFNYTAPTEIYTLSLHDALPISSRRRRCRRCASLCWCAPAPQASLSIGGGPPNGWMIGVALHLTYRGLPRFAKLETVFFDAAGTHAMAWVQRTAEDAEKTSFHSACWVSLRPLRSSASLRQKKRLYSLERRVAESETAKG